jgi:hypothetical protein
MRQLGRAPLCATVFNRCQVSEHAKPLVINPTIDVSNVLIGLHWHIVESAGVLATPRDPSDVADHCRVCSRLVHR